LLLLLLLLLLLVLGLIGEMYQLSVCRLAASTEQVSAGTRQKN